MSSIIGSDQDNAILKIYTGCPKKLHFNREILINGIKQVPVQKF